MEPKAIAAAVRRLRGASLDLLDDLAPEELAAEAVPGWTTLDVFRHLADSDRRTVLGRHLLEFLPGVDWDAFERANDEHIERLAGEDRDAIRDELETWGGRLARMVSLAPPALARVTVPTAFGTVSLGWFAILRPYDEWVHQWDVRTATGRSDPPMDDELRRLLAEFQLRALPAGPLRALPQRDGVVQVRFEDADVPPWRFDLRRREFGTFVRAAPTVSVHADVPSFCLLAGARRTWRDLPGIEVRGRDGAGAAALLDVVRVV